MNIGGFHGNRLPILQSALRQYAKRLAIAALHSQVRHGGSLGQRQAGSCRGHDHGGK
jgi:hypothetical protein